MKNKIPKFKSESQERVFWASHDSAEHIDWSKARNVVLPNLRPSVKSISIRLPESMIEELRLLANKRDIPYQSLLKIYLSDRLDLELKHSRGSISRRTVSRTVPNLAITHSGPTRR